MKVEAQENLEFKVFNLFKAEARANPAIIIFKLETLVNPVIVIFKVEARENPAIRGVPAAVVQYKVRLLFIYQRSR